ncbi:MAG: RNA polymerase sigma factor [Cytophagales bacterium]|nr:RNA polymerase sigma factor [Cytophagales bacterium]
MQDQSICEESRYSEIYSQQAEKLRNFLYYKCGDLAKAEDLAQETFLKLWKKCAEVAYESVVGFLYTVAKRLFLDLVRSEKVILKFEKSLLPNMNSEDPLFQLRTEEFREQVEKAISDLPDGQREAFLLNRIDKLTYSEIADKLEISHTAVEKRISKALARLKDDIVELKKRKI